MKADYYLIPDLAGIDYGKLVKDAMLKQGASFIALKDPTILIRCLSCWEMYINRTVTHQGVSAY